MALKLLFALLLLGGSAEASPPKYVFLFIGDGMGDAQIHLAQMYLGATTKNEKLSLYGLEAHGSAYTHSYDSVVTDSAASATAMASGFKSNNGAIGVDHNAKDLQSLAGLAKKSGKKIGIISTTSIDHATPASFYAHAGSRSDYYEIAEQLTRSNFDLFGAGGFRHPKGKKGDKANVFGLAKKRGFDAINSLKQFESPRPATNKKILFSHPNPGEGKSFPYFLDDPSIRLKDLLSSSIKALDTKAGFFILVEGGKIDWAAHGNDAGSMVHEVLEFDAAIYEALKFQKKHVSETLIVVTADHETGGLSLGNYYQGYRLDAEVLSLQKKSAVYFEQKFAAYMKETTKGHSIDHVWPLLKEVYSMVPMGSAPTAGKWFELDRSQVAHLTTAFNSSVAGILKADKQAPPPNLLYGKYLPLCIEAMRIRDKSMGLSWSTLGHTALPVSVAATGVEAMQFTGKYDNTEIGTKLMGIMGIGQEIRRNAKTQASTYPGWQGIQLK